MSMHCLKLLMHSFMSFLVRTHNRTFTDSTSLALEIEVLKWQRILWSCLLDELWEFYSSGLDLKCESFVSWFPIP
jgi:hypothetical protein